MDTFLGDELLPRRRENRKSLHRPLKRVEKVASL